MWTFFLFQIDGIFGEERECNGHANIEEHPQKGNLECSFAIVSPKFVKAL
uniref:Uncharacterized protein n=1 Tax=Arundo donax TaxID=35708 RepID=A0A0A9C5Y7_ARUDO